MKRKNDAVENPSFLSTGCTLLNLANTDNPFHGFRLGRIVNIIGDTHTGKTLLALTMLAEAANNPAFDNYDLVYDDAEAANSFNLEYLFGKKTASRLAEWYVDNDPSDTVEDWQENLYDMLAGEKPFIYVIDSMDSLTWEDEQELIEENLAARKKGNETKSTYGMGKAKRNSQIMRGINDRLEGTKSLLVIISQVRDNIGMSFAKKYTRAGGRALDFYSSHIMWLSCKQKIKSKSLVIGSNVMAKVSKTKETGKIRDVDFQTYYDYGVDDISSNIEYLLANNVWKKEKRTIVVPELDLNGTIDKVIGQIEERGLQDTVAELVGETWNEIENSVKLNRASKYGD